MSTLLTISDMDTSKHAPPLIALLFEKQRLLDQELLLRLEVAGWNDLTRAQSLVFGQLDAGCTRVSQIAERLGVSRQAIHRTVMELVDAGYLNVGEDRHSGRSKVITMTKKGRRVQVDAKRVFIEIEQELVSQLGASRVSSLRNTLQANWEF